ncbi:hypothetical protein D3C80_1260430 [compost metagenome]
MALVLSAVTVVTMSAPRTASCTESAMITLMPGKPARLRASLRVACGSTSYRRISSMPRMQWKAMAWNSLCEPLPISAMRRALLRARTLAASTEVAAVRSAVVRVSSLSSTGLPVATSPRAPKAITVSMPARVFFGWPLTYLNEYSEASDTGISSITPSAEWLARRAHFSKSAQRR